MLDIADRQLTMRTADSISGAAKRMVLPSTRTSVGHWQNKSAMPGDVVVMSTCTGVAVGSGWHCARWASPCTSNTK